jgi:hypothetical protein
VRYPLLQGTTGPCAKKAGCWPGARSCFLRLQEPCSYILPEPSSLRREERAFGKCWGLQLRLPPSRSGSVRKAIC